MSTTSSTGARQTLRPNLGGQTHGTQMAGGLMCHRRTAAQPPPPGVERVRGEDTDLRLQG